MKHDLLCGAALALMFSASAGAQTCAAPVTTWHPGISGAPALTATTCGGETGIISLCEGAQDAHQQAYVARISVANPGTYTQISITGVSGFTAYVAVVNTTAAGACNGSGDTGHCVTAGDISTPILRTLLADGQSYYVIVSNSGVADTNASCGTFTLTSDGTLPVMLQGFSVI